jgi:hypothetical protein
MKQMFAEVMVELFGPEVDHHGKDELDQRPWSPA